MRWLILVTLLAGCIQYDPAIESTPWQPPGAEVPVAQPCHVAPEDVRFRTAPRLTEVDAALGFDDPPGVLAVGNGTWWLGHRNTTWQRIGNGIEATFASDGSRLIAVGVSHNGIPTTEVIALTRDGPTSLPDLPVPRQDAVAYVDDAIVVMGGRRADGAPEQDDGLRLAPDSDSWQPADGLPAPVADATLAATPHGYFLVGGTRNGTAIDDVWRLDQGHWRPVSSVPVARANAGVTWHCGNLWVVGGDGSQGPLADTWTYDVARRTWTQGPDLLVAGARPAISHCDVLWILGPTVELGVTGRLDDCSGRLPAPPLELEGASKDGDQDEEPHEPPQPAAQMSLNVTGTTAPADVTFHLSGHGETWSLDVDGDGRTDAAGDQLPATVSRRVHEPGDYTARFVVSLGSIAANATAKYRLDFPADAVQEERASFIAADSGCAEQANGFTHGVTHHRFNVDPVTHGAAWSAEFTDVVRAGVTFIHDVGGPTHVSVWGTSLAGQVPFQAKAAILWACGPGETTAFYQAG